MSTDFSEHEADAAAGPTETNAQLHSKSFKLRFASQRELGRSYMSAVKPLRLRESLLLEIYDYVCIAQRNMSFNRDLSNTSNAEYMRLR